MCEDDLKSHQSGTKVFWTVGLLDVQLIYPIKVKVSFALKACKTMK